jgi:hypothetical protein
VEYFAYPPQGNNDEIKFKSMTVDNTYFADLSETVSVLDDFTVEPEHLVRTRFEAEKEYVLSALLSLDPLFIPRGPQPVSLQSLFSNFSESTVFPESSDCPYLVWSIFVAFLYCLIYSHCFSLGTVVS